MPLQRPQNLATMFHVQNVGNLSLYVAKLFSPFQCPNTYPVAVSRIRNESVT